MAGIGNSGLLLVGMHRSGTTALARALASSGYDPGHRLVGGSKGNEEGHWEDAFAVELHENLLYRLGGQWDQPWSIPPDWRKHQSAAAARAQIGRYLREDRTRCARWLVKDPRLCVFWPLWTEAAEQEGQRLRAIMLLRHPTEVADSLSRRDGMGSAHAVALWYDYMLHALPLAGAVPSLLIDYDALVGERGEAVRDVRDFAGLTNAMAAGREWDFIRKSPGVAGNSEALPMPVARLWRAMQQAAARGAATEGDEARSARRSAEELATLMFPLLAEFRAQQAVLWKRAARAEALVSDRFDRLAVLPREIDEVRLRMDAHHHSVIDAVSNGSSALHGSIASLGGSVGEQIAGVGDSVGGLTVAISGQMAGLGDSVSGLTDAISAQMSGLGAAVGGMNAAVSEQMLGMSDRVGGLANVLSGELRSVTTGIGDLSQQSSQGIQRLAQSLADASGGMALHLAGLRESLDARMGESNALIAAMRDEAARRDAIQQSERARHAEINERLGLVLRSRSWRWTRPVRVLMRMLRGDLSDIPRLKSRVAAGHLPQAGHASVRDATSSDQAAIHATPKTPVLARCDGVHPDVFVWGVIDWHFRRQRPQHLARALAEKGHRVFYVSSEPNDDARAGFEHEFLDGSGRLLQIRFNKAGSAPIYHGMANDREEEQLRASLATLLQWTETASSISIVDHPFWARLATMVPNARLVYDCMDHHHGFDNNGSEILKAEADLIRQADLVVTTSAWLEDNVGKQARASVLIRNACDYAHFECAPADFFAPPGGEAVIGYFGAIAEWFDVEIVRRVAMDHPDSLVVLVGADTRDAASALADLPNIRFVGEVPYQDLPYWVHGFDVCMLPFLSIPLTQATNPVKVYEYLAAGKPVVSVDLPEMSQFGDLVHVATDNADFSRRVAEALGERRDKSKIARRKAFAFRQTWSQRAEQLDLALETVEEPPVSVVVLTYNNLQLTKECLESIEVNSDYRNMELIVVDNASRDGSDEWLASWSAACSLAGHRRRYVRNQDNLGFAAGNNVGLTLASGEYVVLLNNDTVVTPGWLRTLIWHLRRDAGTGLVGPVTDNIGNEARVDLQDSATSDWTVAAGAYTRAHCGRSFELRTLAFFCVALARSTLERVGPLDEDFGQGFFEDDDYCRRVEAAGLGIRCAEDVFVHHHLSATFSLEGEERRKVLFEKNKRIYEAKWGPWIPHAYRERHPAAEG